MIVTRRLFLLVVAVALVPVLQAAPPGFVMWSASELAQREKNQLPLDNKSKCADYVITNNAGDEHCFDQVRRVFSLISQAQTE